MLEEHDSIPWEAFPGQMKDIGGGEWRLAERPERLPHTPTRCRRASSAERPQRRDRKPAGEAIGAVRRAQDVRPGSLRVPDPGGAREHDRERARADRVAHDLRARRQADELLRGRG